jgi:hypothetical protein
MNEKVRPSFLSFLFPLPSFGTSSVHSLCLLADRKSLVNGDSALPNVSLSLEPCSLARKRFAFSFASTFQMLPPLLTQYPLLLDLELHHSMHGPLYGGMLLHAFSFCTY